MIQKISTIALLFATFLFAACSCDGEPAENEQEEPVVQEPDPRDLPVADGMYRNPLKVPIASEIADPSVFKYKGKFYLLSTQLYYANGAGMTVWVSENLVTWNVHGSFPVIGDVDPILAPELIYHEGTYYLYFSVFPGEVHYAAKYTPAADDFDPFGLSAEYEVFSYDFLDVNSTIDIDGEIFFDKNDLYMFFCGLGGIHYKQLVSPDSSGAASTVQLTQCVVDNIQIAPGEPGTNGWTEAPGIFYDDGYYYLTYSGVHYLRPDYQIHVARGTAISNIAPYRENPLIAQFTGEYNGMGNNNFITGPDLKTKYLTYHTKVGEGIFSGVAIDRRLMLDRYTVSQSSGIETDAPTLLDEPLPGEVGWDQDMSKVPDDMELVDEGADGTAETTGKYVVLSSGGLNATHLLTTFASAADFVVEGNIRGTGTFDEGTSRYGLSAADGKILIAVETDEATANGTTGEALLSFYTEDAGWQHTTIEDVHFSVWHKLIIDKKRNKVKFYYDDRFVGEETVSGTGGGKFGYYTENATVSCSWIGASDY